jgi:hypothetical protein
LAVVATAIKVVVVAIITLLAVASLDYAVAATQRGKNAKAISAHAGLVVESTSVVRRHVGAGRLLSRNCAAARRHADLAAGTNGPVATVDGIDAVVAATYGQPNRDEPNAPEPC